MINSNTPINFIQDKIRNIGSALFHSEQSSVLKYPTTIITARKVDEFGQIWFYMDKPTQNFTQFDDQFLPDLIFSGKGKTIFSKFWAGRM
jgi:hypothetical protein